VSGWKAVISSVRVVVNEVFVYADVPSSARICETVPGQRCLSD
jgi:hypothetical protein